MTFTIKHEHEVVLSRETSERIAALSAGPGYRIVIDDAVNAETFAAFLKKNRAEVLRMVEREFKRNGGRP